MVPGMFTAVEPRFHLPSERLSREELEGLQLVKLRALLDRLIASNPFYRKQWADFDVTSAQITSITEFRKRVPMITKADVLKDQAEHPPLGSRIGVPRNEIRKVHVTGGTSGYTQEAWGLTAADFELSAKGHVQRFHWMGLEPGDAIFISLPAFFSAAGGLRKAAEMMGLLVFEVFGMDSERLSQLMDAFPPALMFVGLGVPRFGIESDLRPRDIYPSLKSVATYGLSDGAALAALEEAWGARSAESYGCTQAPNTVGSTCEHGGLRKGQPGMVHFFEDRFIVECLDRDTGEPAEPGAPAEVVLTSLDREASPTVRYRLNDRVETLPYNACDCGRPFAGYRVGTGGRWDDMMKVKGVNVWPETFDSIVFSHPQVVEYRGEVSTANGKDELTLRLDLGGLDAGERDRILHSIRREAKARTLLTPTVVASTEPIPKFVDRKARRWTDSRGFVTAPADGTAVSGHSIDGGDDD
jgi:phenylacetate-CoA ligase